MIFSQRAPMISMMNQAAVEALVSATYLQDYLDCMENLPDDIQRQISSLRELDQKSYETMNELSHHRKAYLEEREISMKRKSLLQIQRLLRHGQELGDEKLQISSSITDYIESRAKQLSGDLSNLEPSLEEDVKEKIPVPANSKAQKTADDKQDKTSITTSNAKRQRRLRIPQETKEEKLEVEAPKKKKKRKAKKEEKVHIEPIDPDEPTYCLCGQVSYGEMIGCDNDVCEIEWFHFNCVNLSNKPKGKWYCPDCRGDRPNIKKPNA